MHARRENVIGFAVASELKFNLVLSAPDYFVLL